MSTPLIVALAIVWGLIGFTGFRYWGEGGGLSAGRSTGPAIQRQGGRASRSSDG